jgi:hypothetical protein
MNFIPQSPAVRTVLILASIAVTVSSRIPCSPASLASIADEKPSVEQLLARHLDSIGTAEARGAVKTRYVGGSVKLIARIGRAATLDGKGGIASQIPKLRYTMRFTAPEYPAEQMAYDGHKVATSFLPQGQRSNLSMFLDQQTAPLQDGLLCGTLSASWALLRTAELQPKLEYKGKTKVEGRELHKMSYRPRKGSPDLRTNIYFDPATMRHVRTEYQFEIGARIGTGPNASNAVQESYYLLTEEFDDFRQVEGLTLPHRYRMQLSVNTSRGAILYDWTMTVEQISHRETFDDQTFTLK